MSSVDRKKWDARYAQAPWTTEPSAFLLSAADLLPATGRALDVGGGTGRNAIWLARRGFDVTLVDISPVGLELAEHNAAGAGVEVAALALDLEISPVPSGPWDVVVSFHYLQRNLFAEWPKLLAPGGLLIFSQATESNLERNERPPPRYLLADGELPGLVQGLEVVRYEEGWSDEGRHDACLVARKP